MTIGTRIAGGFAIALAFLAGIGILAYRNTGKLVDTGDWVTHTHKVLEGLETLLSLMKDEETGQRGFLVTGEAKFFEPFKEAEAALGPARKTLENLIEEEAGKDAINVADKKKHLQEMYVAIEERRDFTIASIELAKIDNPAKAMEAASSIVKTARVRDLMESFRDKAKDAKSGLEAARALEKTEKGKELMDAVRKKVKEIQTREETSLKTRQDEAAASVRMTMLTIGVGSALAFVFVGLAGFFIVRSINSTIRDGVGKITTAGAEILASSNQQAAGAQEQAAAVAQTVTTVDEVTQTADQSAQRAKAVGDTSTPT